METNFVYFLQVHELKIRFEYAHVPPKSTTFNSTFEYWVSAVPKQNAYLCSLNTCMTQAPQWRFFKHQFMYRSEFTRFVNWLSIIKLWTCFSALVSSSLRASTATTRAVQPDPCRRKRKHVKIHYTLNRLYAEVCWLSAVFGQQVDVRNYVIVLQTLHLPIQKDYGQRWMSCT
jgi:hypothetical protein